MVLARGTIFGGIGVLTRGKYWKMLRILVYTAGIGG
jgi:hypothetical protein